MQQEFLLYSDVYLRDQSFLVPWDVTCLVMWNYAYILTSNAHK